MRISAALVGSVLLMAAVAASAAPKRGEKGEADLAKALVGRVAGAPVDCISLRNIRNSRVYDGTAIVYEVGGTLYVNRPSGASFLRSDSILITDTHSSQLCSIDIVRLADSASRMQMGSVGLSKFVPYKKPGAK
jgi:hypothetical protein